MPTYDYLCNDCNHQFESFHSITAEPLDTCPECEGQVKRLISAGNGLIFKGSGFYITDYKNSNGSKSDSDSKVKNKKTENKKSDTKSSSESSKKD